MKRKLLMILLTLTLVGGAILGLTACSGDNDNGNSGNLPHLHDYSMLKFDTENHWFECSCGDKTNVVKHNILNNLCVCGYEVTQTHTHDYKTLKFDNQQHWFECSCGNKNDIENHKGGTATETSKAVCSVCNQEYGSTLGHVHNYIKQVLQEQYVKTPAKCESKAQYYYSCNCGEKGTTWFEYGEELGHSYTNYTYNNDAKCEVNGTETATCDNGCGTSDIRSKLGTALEHDVKDYIPDNNATYEEDGTKTATCSREGCNEKHTITDVGTKLESGITFKTLSVNGTDVYGKVSNITETFSFIHEIVTTGTARFVVSLDIYGTQPVATKTIPLTVGDNKVYVIEIIDGELTNVYALTIRRKPMYTVSFNANGGTNAQSQTVEEDAFATKPTTTKTGYTFDSWDYDFSKPVTSDITINASWTANTNTPYKVEYYLQNLENDNYTLTETTDKTGTTNTTANAEIKTFTHFTHKASSTDSGNIVPNGSTVLKVYYTRDKYTVTFDGNGGTLVSGNVTQTVKYGGSVTAPIFEKEGHSFVSFDKTNYTNINESFTATAKWTVNQYSITIVYGNGQENKVITQDYNTEITEKLPKLEEIESRPGYIFEWDNHLPLYMPSYNSTINAVWFSIFELSGNSIIGVTTQGKTLTNIVIPEQIDNIDITEIGWEAFHSFNTLKNITIPNTITNIGSYAFYDCDELESITIPNSVVSIGAYAFYGCNNLKSLTIGENVQNIFREAFRDCASLEQVDFNAKKCSDTLTDSGVPTNVFTSAGYLGEGITLRFGKNVTRIPSGLFAQDIYYRQSIIKEVDFGKSISSIGKYAFSGITFLEKVVIPNSVHKIELGAFLSCVIYDLTVPFVGSGETSHLNFGYIFGNDTGNASVPTYLNNVEITGGWIYHEAFNFCTNIKTITIHDNVRVTGNSAFSECHALTTIVLPTSTTIGRKMFYNCKKLTNVIIPNGVTYVADYAFYGCMNLNSIVLSSSPNIYEDAFACCSLKNIYYSGTSTSWSLIDIGNLILTNRYVYYYVENESDLPTDNGNYWHYVDGIPTVWNISIEE